MRCPSLIYTSSSIPIIHIVIPCECGDSLHNLANVNAQITWSENTPAGSCNCDDALLAKWRNQK